MVYCTVFLDWWTASSICLWIISFETAIDGRFDSILQFTISISSLSCFLHQIRADYQDRHRQMCQQAILLQFFLPFSQFNIINNIAQVLINQINQISTILAKEIVQMGHPQFRTNTANKLWFGNCDKNVDNIKQSLIKLMNRCHSCKNNRRQLLMLKCNHDTCIKCAADNYFINCKNKVNNKKTRNNNYYCQKCLEQTQLDSKTIDTLKQYFIDNVPPDQKNKLNRKEKINERQQHQKQRIEKINKIDHQNTQRPKSLEVEILQRKRTLSKYLNERQVQKFIQMQNQYGSKNKITQTKKYSKNQQRYPTQLNNAGLTPQPHKTSNEYQLNRVEMENQRKRQSHLKQKRNINDSFQKFAEQQRFHNDYMRVNQNLPIQKGRLSHQQQPNPNIYREMQYQIYHNGKGIPNPNIKEVNHILEQEKNMPHTNSRHSSNSSNKVVGTIRSKKSTQKDGQQNASRNTAPIVRQKVTSYKSQDNLQKGQYNQIKLINTEYNTRNIQNTQDWDMESKSTKKHQKTISQGRNQSTVQKILQTFQVSQQKYEPLQRIQQKPLQIQKICTDRQQRVQIYYCKIHEDEEIIYFCLKCNQLICSECALHGSHKSHQIHSLKKSAMILKQTLAHNTNTLSKLLIQEENKQKVFRQCLNEISLQCNKQKEQIRSSFQNFIFHIDKKYKQLLKEIQDKFSFIMNQYSQKLIQSRSNYTQISKIKERVCQTLQECSGFEDGTVSQTNIGAACNQFGNFHIKRPRNKQNSLSGIQYINKLTSRIMQLEQFLRNTNILLFSNKKQSLLSENSSLRLSDSSNLLEDKQYQPTPQTITTPQGRSAFVRVSTRQEKKNRKFLISSYSLNVKSRIKISQCDGIVESLIEMQQIIKSIKPEFIQYQLKSLK